jgi:cytochrome oxidase Cu insertion factor (SCO1/SenC/PrrC family)
MNMRAQQLRRRNQRPLAALAALFLLPLLLAFFLYYGSSWRPAHRLNHGVLITPARALPRAPLAAPEGDAADAAPFGQQWSLVYIDGGACAAACRQALYLMRQTRLALNSDRTRVVRVLLVSGACGDCAALSREDPGLELFDANGAAGAALLREFPAAAREQTVFVVDPLGNLMMSYDAREDPHGLLQDLKKLLKLSHIG